MGDDALQIADLCQAWVDEIVQPDGSVVIALGAHGEPTHD